jgi:YhcG PDDEXK nuclease domain
MGDMFAFVGSQYRGEVGEREFYIDLLLYHPRSWAWAVANQEWRIDFPTFRYPPRVVRRSAPWVEDDGSGVPG